MNEELFDREKIVNYWLASSDSDFRTMEHLFASKDYSWSLFLGHLVIEKLLKALFVQHAGKHALFTHDLLRLAKQCNLELSEEQQDVLDTLTTFNLNARYDNYKRDFQRLCTPEFTQTWILNIKELRSWLKAKL